MRLNAYLARAGVASRRKADDLIKAGRVRINGAPGELNTFVEPGDRVELDGRLLAPKRLAYILLHKPAGVVTTARDPRGRKTVVDLVRHGARVVPVGRLDGDTTGALLLTNDGPLAHRLAHPRYEVEKVYEAEVEGKPDDEALRRLADGVELDDGRTAPARVRRLSPSRIELALHLGAVERLVFEGRRVERRLDLRGERVTLRRQALDLTLDRVVFGVARVVRCERARRGFERVHRERAERRVQLLVRVGELVEVREVLLHRRRNRVAGEVRGEQPPVVAVVVLETHEREDRRTHV